jgi:cytochrome b subunit of formate dehydrogenase
VKAGNEAAPTCAVCHGQVHKVRPAAAAEFRKAEPETCGMCHSQVAEQFGASVHGAAAARGVTAAPVCTDCHGEHAILGPESQASSVSPGHVRETCARCHGSVQLSRRFGMSADRIISFDTSFHGLAARSGSQSVANCASCHGIHNILPSSNPRSTIHPKNLPATCSRCHPGAGRRFALGTTHQWAGRGEAPAVVWARYAYRILIPVVVGLMLLHNLGDWVRKLIARRFPVRPAPPRRSGPPDLRMYGVERLQHGLLAVSFAALVWTGFALKYPDQWWARPLVHWEHYWPVRGTLHRAAAVVMMAAGAAHLAALAVSRRLRRHWQTLWPKRGDVGEAAGMLAYNLGLISRKPRVSAHSYVEKAEYWAVLWGTVIMAATGLMLWFNTLILAWLPKSWLDLATVVHLYEAILATLSIVVWHFYFVIFDPDVYPLETAFLTGYSVKPRRAEAGEEQGVEEGAERGVARESE